MFKKFVLIMLLLALIPTVCLAQTQEEWNLSCNYKTSQATTVYALGADNVVQEVIPANTYVKITDSINDDTKKITYMINGTLKKGKVSAASLVRCSSQYRQSSGMAENVHELDPNHDKILAEHEVILVAPSLLQQGDKDYSDLTFELPESPAAQAAQQTAGRQQSQEEASDETETTSATKSVTSTSQTTSSKTASSQTTSSKKKATGNKTSESSDAVQINVVQLGVHTSVVKYEGQEVEVPTAELQFTGDVPEDKRIASILAPRTGKCSLREKASDSGKVLKKCKAGTVVQVLEYGRKYCRIVYQGQTGYVLTACLTFLDPAAEVMGTTVLTYNGRATGYAKVPVRNTASSDSSIIVQMRSGTEVTVLGKTGKWYEIACEGWHGFVHQNYMEAEIE